MITDIDALVATVREALRGRITAPHTEHCAWFLKTGPCDCGIDESEAKFDGVSAALDALAAETERLREVARVRGDVAVRRDDQLHVALAALREIEEVADRGRGFVAQLNGIYTMACEARAEIEVEG
jgi:hypothetical protein